MRIAVTGPTGHIGNKIVQILQDMGGNELVLLARNPDKLTTERARGATVIKGDLEDSCFVKRATQNVDSLFWMIPPKADERLFRGYVRKLSENAAFAIRSNRIKRVVFLSSIGAHLAEGCGPVSGLHDGEHILRQVSWNLTILRPAYFMENFLMLLESISELGAFFLPVPGSISFPMIATKDIAEVASRALSDTTWGGLRILPLHGPKDYSFEEAARIIGEGIEREVGFVQVSPDQTRAFLLNKGVSEHMADLYLEMYNAIETGYMRDEFPRGPQTTTPTTLEEFTRQYIVPAVKHQHVIKE